MGLATTRRPSRPHLEPALLGGHPAARAIASSSRRDGHELRRHRHRAGAGRRDAGPGDRPPLRVAGTSIGRLALTRRRHRVLLHGVPAHDHRLNYPINDDPLSCFFTSTTPTSDRSSSSTCCQRARSSTPKICRSPRGLRARARQQPTSGGSNQYPIVAIRPGFITDQTVTATQGRPPRPGTDSRLQATTTTRQPASSSSSTPQHSPTHRAGSPFRTTSPARDPRSSGWSTKSSSLSSHLQPPKHHPHTEGHSHGTQSILLIVAVVIAALGATMIFLYVQGIDSRAKADQEPRQGAWSRRPRSTPARRSKRPPSRQARPDQRPQGGRRTGGPHHHRGAGRSDRAGPDLPRDQIVAAKFGQVGTGQTINFPDGSMAMSVPR